MPETIFTAASARPRAPWCARVGDKRSSIMLAVLGLVTASLSSRGGQPSFLSAAAIAQSSSSALLADTAEPSQPVSVSFEGLSFAVGSKIILHGCSGAAAPGRMLAIMGPSGSGKTSLLNALAGQVKGGSSASLTGKLLIDGNVCGGANQVAGLRVAYVRQEDIFYTQMTVRETLLFAARLRLPARVPLAEKERRVDELIEKLALGKAANTIIGDAKRRGISGGERKRLAIGCELLSDPQRTMPPQTPVAASVAAPLARFVAPPHAHAPTYMYMLHVHVVCCVRARHAFVWLVALALSPSRPLISRSRLISLSRSLALSLSPTWWQFSSWTSPPRGSTPSPRSRWWPLSSGCARATAPL